MNGQPTSQIMYAGPDCACEDATILLTERPVRVTDIDVQPLRLAVPVGGYAALDLELQVFEGTDIEVRVVTSMQSYSDDGWIEVDRFAPTSKDGSGPGKARKTFFPLLRYARWEVLSSNSGTFLLHGMGRRRLGFLPTDVDSCVVWLRSDLGVTVVSGAVSSWADKSGRGNGVSQSTSTKRPLYVANAVNGLPALSFDGTDDNLKGALAATLAGTSQEYTNFVVANVDSTTLGGDGTLYELSDSLASTNRGPMLFYETVSGPTTCVWRCFTTTLGQALYSNPPFDSWHIHHAWHTTSERRIYLDNLQQNSNATSVDSRDLTTHSVGLLRPDGSATYPLKGRIAEIIVYQRKLADGEVALVHGYLKGRYGL